jgi:hypothetical protein
MILGFSFNIRGLISVNKVEVIFLERDSYLLVDRSKLLLSLYDLFMLSPVARDWKSNPEFCFKFGKRN